MNSLYVHFPFCKKRCFYCDFYSTTYGHDVMAAYVQALEKELRNRQYIKGTRVHTIYIGGGTPSLLPSKLLKELFCTIGRHFTIEQDAEITIEANPDDVTSEWLKGVAETPVNRISMGAQTFNDKLLGLIGRRHDGRQTVDAVSACREAGLRNISLDLIYGLPEQTMDDWRSDVETALGLNITHLSAYSLTFEEGTRLDAMRTRQGGGRRAVACHVRLPAV